MNKEKRTIKCHITVKFLNAQNVDSEMPVYIHWKRGTKKENSGKTATKELINGSAAFEDKFAIATTFIEEKGKISSKSMSFELYKVNINHQKQTSKKFFFLQSKQGNEKKNISISKLACG